MEKLTVITPTYNRSEKLKEVFESLNKQTINDFIWLIIDDGSTDNTKETVDEFNKIKKFHIEYYYKDNGGKASALNVALDKVKTDYCCCLDSDDTFTPTAIETALKELETEKDNDNCCGVVALRTSKEGIPLGNKQIPSKYQYISIGELYTILDKTELICFYKYKFIKDIKFPTIKGEKFISPTWFQYKATEKRKFKVSNGQFCICEYLDDGLTKNKKSVILKNPKGYTLVKRESLKNSKNIKKTIKHAIMYDYGSLLSKNKEFIKESPKKVATIISLPFALIILLKNKGNQK